MLWAIEHGTGAELSVCAVGASVAALVCLRNSLLPIAMSAHV